MKIGYARVSTHKQSLSRQIKQLKEEGCKIIYKDKCSGSKLDKRVGLADALAKLKEEDILVVSDLTRLSRSTSDLLNTISIIKDKGADIKSISQSWLDTSKPDSKLMLTVFAGLAEFERDLIVARTKEGLEVAKEAGHIGGRPKLRSDKVELAIKMYRQGGYRLAQITEATGVSKTSLHRYLRQKEDEEHAVRLKQQKAKGGTK